MNDAQAQRGGEPVGMMSTFAPWDAALIKTLRLWCDGHDGQACIRRNLSLVLPEAEAQQRYAHFEDLVRTILRYARRPLVRHDLDCKSVGADEAVFANLVGTAATGDLGDAALIATLMAGPAQAERIAMIAGEVGHAMRHLTTSPENYQNETHRAVARLH